MASSVLVTNVFVLKMEVEFVFNNVGLAVAEFVFT